MPLKSHIGDVPCNECARKNRTVEALHNSFCRPGISWDFCRDNSLSILPHPSSELYLGGGDGEQRNAICHAINWVRLS